MTLEELAKSFGEYADRAEDTHVNPIEFTAWLASLEPYLPHADGDKSPVAKVHGGDEYGPCLEWYKHWAEVDGSLLYAGLAEKIEVTDEMTERAINAYDEFGGGAFEAMREALIVATNGYYRVGAK